MTRIRKELEKLKAQCKQLCEEEGWLGPKSRDPNFRLIYTSVGTFERNRSKFAIVGINPAGHLRHADSDNGRERPFLKKKYSAYLDDNWDQAGAGQSRFQRAVQGIAMILRGATPSEAMMAISKNNVEAPKDRIGADAADFLRKTPSLNIIPFRSPKPECLPSALLENGKRIGWKLLCLAKPDYIITLANQIEGPLWKTILVNSGQRRKADWTKKLNGRNDRQYREVELREGQLEGALVFGLPAVVYDKVQEGKNGVTEPLFEVLSQRLKYHGVVC